MDQNYQEHVVSLTYRLSTGDSTRYRPEAQLSFKLEGFTGEIKNNRAIFKPDQPFGPLKAVRDALDPQLNSWSAWVDLVFRDKLNFVFESAERVAWPPPPKGHHVLFADSATHVIASSSVNCIVTRAEYPPPPSAFCLDDAVSAGIALYQDSPAMPKHLLKFLQTFVTILEKCHGGRQQVRHRLNIERRTMSDIGNLCTNGGGWDEGRKFKRGQKRLELTRSRRSWATEIFPELILRQGHHAAAGIPNDQLNRRMPD